MQNGTSLNYHKISCNSKQNFLENQKEKCGAQKMSMKEPKSLGISHQNNWFSMCSSQKIISKINRKLTIRHQNYKKKNLTHPI
uniref:Uncharacterized protein n=1 Tax=Rhizophora mucronata TaxID=61149 RepID=A0A2P2P1J7_RHIMU